MNLGLYPTLTKIMLKGITLFAKDGENMPHAVTIGLGDANKRILNLTDIARGYLFATFVVDIKISQLDIKNGCLQFINTRITTCIIMNIFLMTTIITQGADDVGQLCVIGGDGSCIAQGSQVLARIERMACSVSY